MDNGVLIFIIVFEAIAIVWLASKLKQYQKLEHMLPEQSDRPSPTLSTGRNSTASATAQAAPAASAAAYPDAEEELLDMPGVEPEVNIEEAKRVQLVMARCHYAEFYLEQLDDDYERGQFRHIVNSCMNTARGIADPFFKASALHPLIVLLDKAGWDVERDRLLAEVDDEIIRQRIDKELALQAG